MKTKRPRDVGEILIAVFKLFKALLALLLAVGALSLVHRDVPSTLDHWIDQIGVDPYNRHIENALVKLGFLDAKKLREFSAGFFLYAAIFATEGTGLWMRKRWAEYLTAIVTASFLPWEFISISRHADNLKAIVIGVNVATVIYLVLRIRKPLHEN